MDLYSVSLSGDIAEDDLTRMFAALPPKCIVLLEDIDSSGINREKMKEEKKKKGHYSMDSDSDSDSGYPYNGWRRKSGISLSGLLNVIDGTSSHEGRLLIMTSNKPDDLDEALIRPGRVDKQIFFGPMSQSSAACIFRRMFTVSEDEDMDSKSEEVEDVTKPLSSTNENLDFWAARFAEKIPQGKLSPAEVQGFLLAHRASPVEAIDKVEAWVQSTLDSKNVRATEETSKAPTKRKSGSKSKPRRTVFVGGMPSPAMSVEYDSDTDDESEGDEDLDEVLDDLTNSELAGKIEMLERRLDRLQVKADSMNDPDAEAYLDSRW